MTCHTLLLITLAGFLIGCVSATSAQEPSKPLLSVYRYMGFRPAHLMTPQSDYTFEVHANRQWTYRARDGIKRQDIHREGELPVPIESLEERLTEMGISELPQPDPNAPQIADIPKMTIRRELDGESRVHEVRPGEDAALRLHFWIQSVVTGIKELPADAYPLHESDPRAVDNPWQVRDTEELLAAFGESSTSDALSELIDFDAERLLVFRWQGSGQDRLYVHTEEGDASAATFIYAKGATRDLRQHVRMFVLPRSMEWEFEEVR